MLKRFESTQEDGFIITPVAWYQHDTLFSIKSPSGAIRYAEGEWFFGGGGFERLCIHDVWRFASKTGPSIASYENY